MGTQSGMVRLTPTYAASKPYSAHAAVEPAQDAEEEADSAAAHARCIPPDAQIPPPPNFLVVPLSLL
eukprot:scaffold152076_cov21-Tisochrysis_lutea.AAC.1